MRLKVIAVSQNANSFGLKQMILIGDNGTGWSAVANSLNLLAKGQIIENVNPNDVTGHMAKMSFELPRSILPPSDKVMAEAWGELAAA